MKNDTQSSMIGRMRLRSGIKTPSAEEQQQSATALKDDTFTPKRNSSPAKRDPPPSAKRNASPRKRKAGPVEEVHEEVVESAKDEESEDEMAELEGALSASEDDDLESEASANEDGSDDEHDTSDGDSENQEEDDDAIHSDDIPSEEEESLTKIPPLKPGQVPGLDPENMGDGDNDLRNYRIETDANGNEKYIYDEIDPVYDSDDTDANEPANTIGNIDMKFYDSYPHIGYDINGKKIMRPAAGDALDALLDSIEVPKGWTGLTDPTTGKPLNLSQDELELIKKIQMNELPQDGFDPYPVCPCSLDILSVC